ncbi:molybdopterin molybdochelatase [Roseovarius azorensis]|uniref:Molybdopterin molybdenumtransferase n=1 Tax=Roseovarius azorensis TaxID=1287727 RepID=A0A1H7JM82_9RHOB|nr:gephyrin-like molybdotransferase Glp [Roseovarius azorensis]SEK75060.1 molybdopterin molybdochelatase [Roseovarius azorensis]
MTLANRLSEPGCGCDAPENGGSLLSIDAALGLISGHANAVAGTETLAPGAARGRILALPVLAETMLPPFDNAAMDGYALDCVALKGDGPWRLTITHRIAAGQAAMDPVGATQAARIFTGAPIPPGTSAVVMQEEADRTGDQILLRRRPSAGQNIRRAGEDMIAGTQILATGERLDLREIAACAAAGCARVTVRRPLRVALLVTGDEVRDAGATLGPAQIRDINTPMLRAALSGAGVHLAHVERTADRRYALQACLTALADEVDLIVTTGGVSVGEEDHVKPAVTDAGGRIFFAGVALKPGKPVSFGRLGRAFWLGLPGNPFSAIVTWQLFGLALLRRLCGQTGGAVLRRHVVTGAPIRHRPGRCELRPARLAGFDGMGREVAHFETATHSARVAGLSQADGLIFIPSDADYLPEGSLVEFQPFCDR